MKNHMILFIKIILINAILLLVFLFIAKKSGVFYVGATILFYYGLFSIKNLRLIDVILLYLAYTFPFTIIAIVFQINNYFDSFSFLNLRKVIPYFFIANAIFIIIFSIGVILQRYIVDKTIKKIITISVLSLFVTILSGALGWSVQYTAAGITYFISGILVHKIAYKPNIKIYLILILPFVVLFYPFVFYDSLTHVYPLCFIVPISGILGFVLGHIMHRRIYFISLAVVWIAASIVGYWGMENWIAYSLSESNTAVYTNADFKFYDIDNNLYSNETIDSKLIVLYFWTNSCNASIKKLPDLERLYQDYKDNESVFIASVCIKHLTEDKRVLHDKLRSKGYKFPILFLNDSGEIRSIFKIKGFPHVAVINENGRVIYNGGFNNRPFIYYNNVSRIIRENL